MRSAIRPNHSRRSDRVEGRASVALEASIARFVSARPITGVSVANMTAASTGPIVAKNVVKLARNEESMPIT